MSTVWVIIRSEIVESFQDENVPPPTVCGVYNSREEAVEEILKLYIEDDIDLYFSSKNKDKNNSDKNKSDEGYDYRPTPEIVKEHRSRLLDDEYYTYTNRGNLYTLVECVIGAKHEFENDVMTMYNNSK